MLSVRRSREFHGDGPISLVALSKLEQRTFPVSVRELASIDDHNLTGTISAGDVSCDFIVTLYNTGNWYVSGTFHDTGTFFGDSFMLEFLLERTHGIGTKLEGSLDFGDSTTIGKKGNDPWIRQNWARVKTSQITARLTVDPDITIGGVFAAIVLTSFVAGAAYVFSGRTQARPCQDQPVDDHHQCVEFTRVE